MSANFMLMLGAALLLFGVVCAANVVGRAATERRRGRAALIMTGAICFGAALWSALIMTHRLETHPLEGLALLGGALASAALVIVLLSETLDGATERGRIIAGAGLCAIVVIVGFGHVIAAVADNFEHPAIVLGRLFLACSVGVLGLRLAARSGRTSHLVVTALGVTACVGAELLAPPMTITHDIESIETHSVLPTWAAEQKALEIAAKAVAIMTVLIGLTTFTNFGQLFLVPAMAVGPRGAHPRVTDAPAPPLAGQPRPVDRQQAMALALDKSIDRREVHLHFQPQRRLSDGALIGAEALARWRPISGNGAPPDRFIAAAEKHGVINKLGGYVLREACREAARWPKALHVAVNVSPLQLQHLGFEDQVWEALREVDLSPRRLELEITESAFAEAGDFDPNVLTRLRQGGVVISIDDFGKGHSALARLQELQIDRIKLDRAVAGQVSSNSTAKAITRSVVELAKEIQVEVLAEGVETAADLEMHRSLGCDFVQGYGIGRPMRADDFPKAAPPWPLSS